MRCEAVYGFNSKQWWAYDNETDEYCDPPTEVLDSIESHSSDIDEQEEYFNKILDTDPNWLYDDGYRYNDIDI